MIDITGIPIYCQRDYVGKHLGLPTALPESTIPNYGCTIGTIAEKSTILGITLTPPQVQDALAAHGGFGGDTHNLVLWSEAAAILPQFRFNGLYRKLPLLSPLNATIMPMIRERLAKDDPVIVYVDASAHAGLQQHFVLIVGENAGGFVIANPWNGKVQDLRPYGLTDEQAICGAVWLDAAGNAPKQDWRIVTATDGLRIRKDPTTQSARVGLLNFRAPVLILERRDGWGRIDTPIAGWIDLEWTASAPKI